MNLKLPKPGLYVVAVSGGVDSMVLLDLAAKLKNKDTKYDFIVAHLDHGIRTDSDLDKINVKNASKEYRHRFVSKKLNLKTNTSEAKSREERYKFLTQVVKKYKAEAILTAHHQDDLIETALINLIRGTGRKGLSSILDNKKVLRPLIIYPKKDLIKYGLENNLMWREDSTNSDDNYLRNYIRLNITSKLKAKDKLKFVNLINNISTLNIEIDDLLFKNYLNKDIRHLNRVSFNELPHSVSIEVLANWLRANNVSSFDRKILERTVVYAKIGTPGQRYPVKNLVNLKVYKNKLALEPIER
ncbi:MAG TPA: tRNA lysidine(34) synthetase TilS [Patescibacteria group bacterium]|nr:tRNA lysidine(34) synthetase TilS [Patescibacteria group bacterium]